MNPPRELPLPDPFPRPPELPPAGSSPHPPDTCRLLPDDEQKVAKLCTDAFEQLTRKNGLIQNAILDDSPSYYGVPFPPQTHTYEILGEVKPYGIVGTKRFAIALAAAKVKSRLAQPGPGVDSVDRVDLFFVFRRPTNEWKLIYVTKDEMPDAFKFVLKQLTRSQRNGANGLNATEIKPPELLAPFDKAPADPGALPNLEWTGGGRQVSSYLTECQFDSGSEWSSTFKWLPETSILPEKKSMLSSFGGPNQSCKWRVWAIGPSGQTALSDWRTIQFGN